MDYIKTKDKQTKDTLREVSVSSIKGIDTKYILMGLVARHKFFLVSAYAIILSVYFFLPFLPDYLFSLLRSL